MTVIVIAIGTIMEIIWRGGQVFNGFSNPHYLQGLFAIDAGGCLKITLQCSRTDVILFG